MSRRVIVIAVIAVLLVIAGLAVLQVGAWLTKANQPSAAPCVNNLRVLSSAKQQWSLANDKRDGDTVTLQDLRPYLPEAWTNGRPICPDGGLYALGPVGQPPTCSLGGPRHTCYE